MDFAEAIDEAQWAWRLDADNHSAFFPTHFTFIVDSAPEETWRPVRSGGQRGHKQLYNPKYARCIFKFQICCTFKRDVCSFTGIHKGVRHDHRIACRDILPLMDPREKGLGDGAYNNTPQIVCKCDRPNTRTRSHRFFNKIIDTHRARIEHLVKRVKGGHALFKMTWRGAFRVNSTKHLHAPVKITGHMTAFKIRHHGPHCRGSGNWRHW